MGTIKLLVNPGDLGICFCVAHGVHVFYARLADASRRGFGVVRTMPTQLTSDDPVCTADAACPSRQVHSWANYRRERAILPEANRGTRSATRIEQHVIEVHDQQHGWWQRTSCERCSERGVSSVALGQYFYVVHSVYMPRMHR